MILDTSAVVAVVLKESGYEELLIALAREAHLGIGAPTLVETGIVLSARLQRDAQGVIERLMSALSVRTVRFGEIHSSVAVDAWLRFGKGRHPASLNLGDCASYATAKVAAEPLLCVGNDFVRTDLDVVCPSRQHS